METVAIVGVGLIGGSFALALREAGFRGVVLGVSSAPAVREALERGIIDEAVTIEQAARRAELVYLSRPILGILESLEQLRGKVGQGTLVTDGGSTKQTIVERARACLGAGQFLGGHPVAGKEVSGVGAAEGSLFRGRPYVLTPTEPQQLDEPLAKEFRGWVERIGAKVVTLDPLAHDRMLALTSHLPQMLSTVLAGLVGGDEPLVAGTGLAGMLRLAHSPYSVWGDIFATNSTEVDAVLGRYIEELEEARRCLREGRLEELFRRANEAADRVA